MTRNSSTLVPASTRCPPRSTSARDTASKSVTTGHSPEMSTSSPSGPGTRHDPVAAMAAFWISSRHSRIIVR